MAMLFECQGVLAVMVVEGRDSLTRRSDAVIKASSGSRGEQLNSTESERLPGEGGILNARVASTSFCNEDDGDVEVSWNPQQRR